MDVRKPPLRILLSAGEPAGVGPELLTQLVQQPPAQPVELIALADPDLLAARARQVGLALQLSTVDWDTPAVPTGRGELRCLAQPPRLATASVCGRPDPANAGYVLTCLQAGVDLCLSGRAAALVTAPVQKSCINEAGTPFTGHTEWLAERCHAPDPVMLLTAGSLRVALATTHLPLRAVADAITRPALEHVLQCLHRGLIRDFGIARPRIGVAGLNPHAGEAGHLGDEEVRVISPLLDQLRSQGLDLSGPLPADTLFTPRQLAAFDAVLCMYHDQGLPVLKHVGFGHAVNVTLGLPIVRTSVDHGTALDLAGTGKADVGSLRAALMQALSIAEQRRTAA